MKRNFLVCVAVALSLIGCSKGDDKVNPSDGSAPGKAATATAPPAATTVSEPVAVAAPASPPAADALPATAPPSTPTPPVTVAVAPAPAVPESVKAVAISDLSSDQVTGALKEALGKGLQAAVAQLGKPGGFLNDPKVKIPMPDKLQSVETGLRAIGQGEMADQFVATMNQAAEQAVPAAASVFADSLKSMTVADAKKILTGPDDAATQYFRSATGDDLTKKFLPIVKQATASSGTTAKYKQILDKAKAAIPFFSAPSLDLDSYVTGKAMDGLFKMVAQQEKQIRQNPVARTSDLLKSVFGAVTK